MLPAATRLTRREDFATAVRRGCRTRRGTLVAHLACPSGPAGAGPGGRYGRPPLVGFVVGRAVGGSVVRHRVQRRLRHLMRDRLDDLPTGALLVVRALPAAAAASGAALAEDLDAALRAVTRRLPRSDSGLPVSAGDHR